MSFGAEDVLREQHAGHRLDVGVVEHHALGSARRAARVDEQGQVVGRRGTRQPVRVARLEQRGGVDRVDGHLAGTGRFDDGQADTTIGELVGDLVGREGRVDRGEDSAEVPRRVQGDDELDPVGEHGGDDVAAADAGGGEPGGGGGHRGPERGRVEPCPSVGDGVAGAAWVVQDVEMLHRESSSGRWDAP